MAIEVLLKIFFPNAQIVADHFHVVRLLHPAINRHKKAITGDDRKNPLRKMIKKNGQDLKLFEGKAIERLLEANSQLEAVYKVKEWMHKLNRCRRYKKARACFISFTDWLADQEVKELRTL